MALLLAVEDPSVEGARAGDPLAWADLYERYHPIIARYLEIVAPSVDPEEVWGGAGRALAGQPVGINPIVWLLRAAREFQVEAPDPTATENPVVAAVRRLPHLQMEVLALRVVGRLDEDDVAAVVGWPPSRVIAVSHAALGDLMREGEFL